jgi:predicted ATPase
LWNCVFDRADLEQSLDIANTLLEHARGGHDPEQLGLAYRAVGASRFNRGEFSEALTAFHKSIEACGNLDNDNTMKTYGEAPAIVSLAYSGWILSIQGRLDEGLENGERALAMARQCGYPLLIAFTRDVYCNYLTELRGPAACLALAEEAQRFAGEHFLIFWEASHTIKAGWARASIGDAAAGIKEIRAGIEGWKGTGAALHLPTWSCLLAEALLISDAADEAAHVLEDGLTIARKNGELLMLAELHRLRGRLQARLLRVADAEADFLRAVEVARQQGARLFELRATSDLAQFWTDQGSAERARDALAPVLRSFPKTFDTPDFRQAQHLLERLSGA